MPKPDLAIGAIKSGAAEDALSRLAQDAVDIALAGDIKRGLATALEASRRARAAGDRRAELEALNAAARCHSLRNDSINALAAGIDAATLARELNDGVALGHALCAIVNTAFTLKLLQECEPFLERAIEEALKHRNADLESRARQAYGVLLGDLDRFDEARTELQRAVEAARRDGHAGLLLRVEGNLINVARKMARGHAARGEAEALHRAGAKALADAAALLEREGAQAVLSLKMNMMGLTGEVHALLGDVDLGISELETAMDMARSGRQPATLPPFALMRAKLLRERGRQAEAADVLQQGLDAADTLRPTFRIAELCDAMAAIEIEREAPTAADTWHARARQEREQFESGRRMAAGFLKRLQADLDSASRT